MKCRKSLDYTLRPRMNLEWVFVAVILIVAAIVPELMYTEQNIELHSPVQFPLFCQSPAFRRKLSGGFSLRYSCISTTTPAKACGELPPKGGTPTRKYSKYRDL